MSARLAAGRREWSDELPARLITQRSEVQILPPLHVKYQVRGPFSLRGGSASGVGVNEMSTGRAAERVRTTENTGGAGAHRTRDPPPPRGPFSTTSTSVRPLR